MTSKWNKANVEGGVQGVNKNRPVQVLRIRPSDIKKFNRLGIKEPLLRCVRHESGVTAPAL
jgi:hypothetical protein